MDMLRIFRCDLHVHTCLSPCAELDMYPQALIDSVIAAKVDLIAVTDHNASENVPHVLAAARGKPVTVLPGMEVATREEVHTLALLDTLEALAELQAYVYAHLRGANREEIFGCQAIVNAQNEVEGFNDHLLIGAADIGLPDLIDRIHRLGGLAVASHIDRDSFSVLSQLGFIGPDTPFDALEVTPQLGIHGGRARFPELARFPFLTASDAHLRRDIGRGATDFLLCAPTVTELKLAFAEQEGRRVCA